MQKHEKLELGKKKMQELRNLEIKHNDLLTRWECAEHIRFAVFAKRKELEDLLWPHWKFFV